MLRVPPEECECTIVSVTNEISQAKTSYCSSMLSAHCYGLKPPVEHIVPLGTVAKKKHVAEAMVGTSEFLAHIAVAPATWPGKVDGGGREQGGVKLGREDSGVDLVVIR